MSTHSLSIRLSGFCVALAIAFLLIANPAEAAKQKRGKGKKQAESPEAMIDQLAKDVFARANKGSNETLNRSEFKQANKLLRSALATWATNGRLARVRKSSWKPADAAVDTSRIDKHAKVSLAEFTDYTRSAVQQAVRSMPQISEAKPKLKAKAKQAKAKRLGAARVSGRPVARQGPHRPTPARPAAKSVKARSNAARAASAKRDFASR